MKSQARPFYVPRYHSFSNGKPLHFAADGNTAIQPFLKFYATGVTDLPTAAPSNPKYDNVDFSTLSCSQLQGIIDEINNILTISKLDPAGYAYYTGKLSAAQSALANCNKSTSGGGGTGSGGSSGGGGTTVVVPGLIPVLPVLTNPQSGGIASYNPNATTGAALSPGGAGGGGGADAAAKKKFNWWLVFGIAAIGIGVYKTAA